MIEGQPLRRIAIHLTLWAPGCAELTASDPGRRRVFDPAIPSEIFERLVTFLGISPPDLSIELVGDEIHVVGPVADRDRPRQPLAVIWRGMSANEARAFLQVLQTQDAPTQSGAAA